NEGTLVNWVSAYRRVCRREHAGEEPPLTVSERARLCELEREARELKMENEFLKKSRGVLCQGSSVSDKFEFIDVEYAAYQESDEQYVHLVGGGIRHGKVSAECGVPGCPPGDGGQLRFRPHRAGQDQRAGDVAFPARRAQQACQAQLRGHHVRGGGI